MKSRSAKYVVRKPLLEGLKTRFQAEERSEGNILYVRVKSENYLETAKYLKEQGFRRLITISAVDWIDKGVYEVYFLVYNSEDNLYAKVATETPRDAATLPSLSTLWENAELHEREAWEMFGITFDGNNMLKPLFLEDPPRIPPFRKEFDWREEVRKKYGLTWPEY